MTSVAWAADGKHVAVGTASAQVQIWDAARGKQIRALKGHSARVSAMAWSGTTLSTGGRDSLIINHDVRCALHTAPAAILMTLPPFAWRQDGTYKSHLMAPHVTP